MTLTTASLWALVTNKKRLIIEYGMLIVLIAVAGFSLALWVKGSATEERLHSVQGDLGTMQGRLNTVERVNQQHEQTITDLKQLRLQDSRALEDVLTTIKVVSETDTRVRNRLEELKKKNGQVSNFLDMDIPLDMQCVLDNSCNPASPDPIRPEGRKILPSNRAAKPVPASGTNTNAEGR